MNVNGKWKNVGSENLQKFSACEQDELIVAHLSRFRTFDYEFEIYLNKFRNILFWISANRVLLF